MKIYGVGGADEETAGDCPYKPKHNTLFVWKEMGFREHEC